MSPRIARKVLFIGWDAADWRVIHPMIDAGKMPNLQCLIERGVMGNMSTLHPVLSPMLWTTIATGKRPYKHGILGFAEPTPDGTGIRPVSSLSRKTKAFWNILHQNHLKTNVVGWWPSAPVEPINGVMVSNHYQRAVTPLDQPWPLPPGTIHPERLQQTLKDLRFHPSELVGEQVLPFVPDARQIDQDQDPRLGTLMKILAECVSVHAAATWVMENQPWDLMAIYYDAIDHFGHAFMKYHPPRQQFISEADFNLYSGVIEAAYRFHDMMLGAVLALAGQDAHVLICSDHGFHPDHNRPAEIPVQPAGPAVEHRDVGIVVMAGPGMRQDELVHGASLLDVTPTLLTLLGLPIGEDMDGKPLVQAFESTPTVETIPSWDAVEGDAAMHPPDAQFDPIASQQALNQLVQLGYIEKLDEDREKAVSQTARELQFNLARAYMDGDLHADAIPILKDLYHQDPDQHRFGLLLAFCYRALDWIDPLRALIETLHERRVQLARQAREKLTELNRALRQRKDHPDQPTADPMNADERREYHTLLARARIRIADVEYLRGYVAAAEGDHDAALRHLLDAEKAEPRRPALHLQIGEAYLQLKRWNDAERAFQKGLDIDPENPHAHLGLARTHLKRRRPKRAAAAAVKAVSLLYNFPMAHFVLGQALARMRRDLQAANAFEVAIALNPNFAQAHQRLAQIYQNRLAQPDKAKQHRDLAIAIRKAPKPMAPKLDPSDALPVPTQESVIEMHLHSMNVPTKNHEPVVTIVTGLPRSGTSMMMQMLAAGGVPILTDGKRRADEDNPRGYYELEAATQLRTNATWLDDAVGNAVKIVAQLIPFLPKNHKYRIVFMQRHLDEVLVSQTAMLDRLGRNNPPADLGKLRDAYRQQLRRVKLWIARTRVPVIFVDYAAALENPQSTADALAAFLGNDLDVTAMAAAADPALRHQKQSTIQLLAAGSQGAG